MLPLKNLQRSMGLYYSLGAQVMKAQLNPTHNHSIASQESALTIIYLRYTDRLSETCFKLFRAIINFASSHSKENYSTTKNNYLLSPNRSSRRKDEPMVFF